MFRTCEMLMYGGLLSTGLWLGSQSFAQDTFPKASDPFAGTPRQGFQGVEDAANSPADVNRRRVADHLRQARTKLQQGQRDEALRLTARAAAIAKQYDITFGPNELSPQRLVAEIQAASKNPVAVTPASEFNAMASTTSAMDMPEGNAAARVTQTAATLTDSMPAVKPAGNMDVQAQRELVQKLLRDAQYEIAEGKFDSARSKIEQARGFDVTYNVFDLRPEHLLAELARHQPARPEGPSELLTDLTKMPEKAVPQVQSQPAVAPKTQESAKAEAVKYMTAAKAAFAQGHYDEARELAIQAQRKDVTWGLLDENPEYMLAELERLTNKQVITSRPTPAATGDAQKSRAAALELLAQARSAMSEGRVDVAQEKANEAQALNASFALFDDRPDLVLQEIRMLQARNTMSPRPPVGEAAPEPAAIAAAPSTQAAPNGMAGQQQKKDQASSLLHQARESMRKGDLSSAQALVEKADSFDVAFGLFEDNPDVVREDLGRMIAARNNTTPKQMSPEVAPASLADSRESLKSQSTRLLTAAREDLRSGRIEDARAKAIQAASFDVSYDLFEDSPERLLSEVEVAARTGSSLAMNNGAQQNPAFADRNTVAPASNAVDITEATKQPVVTTALGGAAGRDRSVVNTAGLSAQELFDKGVNSLRSGDRETAYEMFLQAYHSGDKLDSYRQQQLQDKLRELSPRRREIQTASNEVASAGRLDAVAEQRSVQFDKVRTECLNAIFRAEKLRDKQPDQAITLLNQTLETIAASDLSPEQAASLTTWVKSSRSSIESFMAQRAPVIELERKNTETKNLIEREIQTRVRVEQELANLVQKFNELMEQKRFAEANAIAKQAAALDAENPAVVTMGLKSQFALRIDRNEKMIAGKEESFYEQLQAVEEAAINPVARDDMPLAYPENWEDIKKTRGKRPADAREHTEAEMRVRRSLSQPVSLHFNNAPLSEVLKYIADTQGINVMVDETGLTEEAVTSSTPISINVDGIQLKSALNLILDPLNLGYTIQNEVLNVTSRMRKQGGLETIVYQVADLIVPVSMNAPVSRLNSGSGYGGDSPNILVPKGLQSVGATPGQNGFAQVPSLPNGGFNPSLNSLSGEPVRALNGPNATNHGFSALTELITTTVSPETWQEVSGAGSINNHESTMSLVVRQTQAVHQEIADLLDQLRRLQDLQVTIEVRFITVSDQFFEQIGIDFDFNINDTIGGPNQNNDFSPMRPFGSVDPIFGGTGGGSSGSGGGGGGGSGSSGGATSLAPFGQGPTLNLQDRDNWPSRTVVGLLNNTQTFSPTLDIPFRQGSFDLAAPTFGGFDPNAGISMGMAILSDIEAFMFVRAAQGDRRSNVMFAPKVTLFNGQIGSVMSMTQRPFVMSLTPVASAFNIGYQPEISVIGDGTSLTVQAIVSADRRYVRLSVLPLFQNVTDVFTFSYLSAGGGGGNTGGIGGGGGGGNTSNFGGGGGGGGGTGIGGGGGGNNNNTAAGTVTVQQPVVAVVTVSTVVSVPDGGTVLLGGVKSLREGRNMAGVPILNKIPYISRLFKNTGVGRETSSLMMMVTPRIIIQEEQEQLLGIPQ